jgi:hypothetical protein
MRHNVQRTVLRGWAFIRPLALAMVVSIATGAMACNANPAGPTDVEPPDRGGIEGLVPFNDQPWSGLTTAGWRYLLRTSARNANIVTDATAPASPPDVLRIVFTPGMPRDTEPGVHWVRLPATREVYTSWWLKLSANWTSSPAGAVKMTFLHASPDGRGQVYAALGESTAPHAMIVNTEWAPYGQRFWVPNVTSTPISYNRWYRFDWYVKWPSMPRADDGIMRWWVDRALNGNYGNVAFPADGTGFQQFEFAPTVQRPPSVEQYMYVDHTTIEIRR